MYDFRGRPLLSKPLNPLSPTMPAWGGATHIMAVIALDSNGLPIEFHHGGGGDGDMSKAIIVRFDQTTPSASWRIVHKMNCYPSVRVDDGNGNAGIPDVDWISKDELVVLLGREMTGSAYLNRYPYTTVAGGNGETLPAEFNFSDPNNLVIDISTADLPPTAPGIENVDYEDRP